MAKGWSFDSLVKALKEGAFLDVGKTKETVAAGDDSRIVNALQKGSNLSDVASVEDSRKNLGVFPQHGSLDKMDLNDLDGRLFGVWLQKANVNTEGKNYPSNVAGTLMVLKNGVSGGISCTQLYYPHNNGGVFWIRYKWGNADWSEWKCFESSDVLRPLITTAQNTANNANTNANGRVPNTRKVNGKPLSADITLTAGDVGASTPAQVNEAKTMATTAQNTANSAVTKADNAQKTANDGVSKANTAQTTANNANNNANGRVPNTRKVNGKQLNGDITLNAGDVGALTQAQGDARYQKLGVVQTLRQVWKGESFGAGGTVNMNEDIRGKTVYIKINGRGYMGVGIMPVKDELPIAINWWREFQIMGTRNNGKTAYCVDSSYGINEIWVQS